MKKILILILVFSIIIAPVMAEISSKVDDNISDKIIITTDEVLLNDSKYMHSAFYNLKIYNNDNTAYKIKSISSACTYEDKLHIKDLYKYYLKENDTEGRFPHTFEVHLFAILSFITPVTFLLFWATIYECDETKFDLFIKKPVKSIILIPSNIVYKIKEGQRNKQIRKELKKHYKMTDIFDYSKIENLTIEPGTELMMPIATEHSFVILENIETHKEYRFNNGKIFYINN